MNLIYITVLVSGRLVIQYFCRLFCIIGNYKLTALIPCAIQYILVTYLFYT